MPEKPVPEGYQTVTPHLTVRGVEGLLEFTRNVFGAKEKMRMPGPDGRIVHAEVEIGDSVVMMGEPMGDSQEVMPATLYVYVSDVDAVYRRAVSAGAASLMEPADRFYGDRTASVRDSTGNQWVIATHIEDVAPEELDRRMKAMMQRRAGG